MRARAPVFFILVVGVAGYLMIRPPSCGGKDAVACPAPDLANGLGTTVPRREACDRAGYLCEGRRAFQVRRWSLEKGRLRIRVPPPPMEDRDEARRPQDAAVAGILRWDGHPFPLRIDRGRIPLHPWDVELYWVPRASFGEMGGGGSHAGLAWYEWREGEHGPDFSVRSISTVTFQRGPDGGDVPASSELVETVSAHEMGHALGLPHSDRPSDIMWPSAAAPAVTERDLRAVQALYRLPNGARVSGG